MMVSLLTAFPATATGFIRPLLLNQWANVVRWEPRPRLLMRTTEFLRHGGHTAHVNGADAMRETRARRRYARDDQRVLILYGYA